jgi:hypothetical protein
MIDLSLTRLSGDRNEDNLVVVERSDENRRLGGEKDLDRFGFGEHFDIKNMESFSIVFVLLRPPRRHSPLRYECFDMSQEVDSSRSLSSGSKYLSFALGLIFILRSYFRSTNGLI